LVIAAFFRGDLFDSPKLLFSDLDSVLTVHELTFAKTARDSLNGPRQEKLLKPSVTVPL
jgi:hypothetical protein